MTKKLRRYKKEDFLNDFADIWEYRFKQVKSGKYRRYDLQIGDEYVDTKTIEYFLDLYYDFLDDSEYEIINGIKFKKYFKALKKIIGASND